MSLDGLPYACPAENLDSIEQHARHLLARVGLRDTPALLGMVERHHLTHALHLAAESHMESSVAHPVCFVITEPIVRAPHHLPSEISLRTPDP